MSRSVILKQEDLSTSLLCSIFLFIARALRSSKRCSVTSSS
ncbi:unnamed protein product [Amoebophrya sp. A25]|nr:unnamed protein product [Amoebophrya sp. A25]|eukprot:GSA25T00001990001.1